MSDLPDEVSALMARRIAWAAKMLDSERITEEWLKSVGFEWWQEMLVARNTEHDHIISLVGNTVHLQGRMLYGVKTRGQLRMLATALGIELKESR